ncbi:MAG: metal ABC transporter solute-binding protein, Zn/Mn family [Solirubrobacteraceae bacterium]
MALVLRRSPRPPHSPPKRRSPRPPRVSRSPSPAAALLCAASVAASLGGCGVGAVRHQQGTIIAVGAESQYANVISQVGGRYVHVSAIMSNPNTDPHSFEASPSVAATVSAAGLVVQNGAGYDAFMNKIESAGGAASQSSRKVIDVQKLLGLPDYIANPHLWYAPRTMPAVAHALAADLSRLQPAHAVYFHRNERAFDSSLQPWRAALARFAASHPHTRVATTEPVGDYMLQAAGVEDLTPASLQADVMNGVDPAPQAVTLQQQLLSRHRVAAFLYNQQVTDPLTASFLQTAKQAGIPVVGLYETMPAGYDYQRWMLAELRALERAVARGVSTEKL